MGIHFWGGFRCNFSIIHLQRCKTLLTTIMQRQSFLPIALYSPASRYNFTFFSILHCYIFFIDVLLCFEKLLTSLFASKLIGVVYHLIGYFSNLLKIQV